MATCLWIHPHQHQPQHHRYRRYKSKPIISQIRSGNFSGYFHRHRHHHHRLNHRIYCNYDGDRGRNQPPNSSGIQLYRDIERLLLLSAYIYFSLFACSGILIPKRETVYTHTQRWLL